MKTNRAHETHKPGKSQVLERAVTQEKLTIKPEAQREMPTAKGPMTPKLGLLTATAYTVDTSTNSAPTSIHRPMLHPIM